MDRCLELALEAKQSALSLDHESRFIRELRVEHRTLGESAERESRCIRLQRVQCNIFLSIEYNSPNKKSSSSLS